MAQAQRPAHDSAGIAFGGRQITSTGFDDDTGASDELLLDLLATGDERSWMARLADCRLIVPIVAAPAEVDTSGELAVEKETDMAVVTLTAPDGVTALPVFTGVQALTAWNPAARPSPVTAVLAAQAALSEGCDLMLVDLGAEHFVTLRRPMVEALATGQPWVSLDADPIVARGLQEAAAPHADVVRAARAEDAGDGVLRVRLALVAGLDADRIQQLAASIGERLAADVEVRSRIEGLEFAVEQA